jgi:hypothetical protein
MYGEKKYSCHVAFPKEQSYENVAEKLSKIFQTEFVLDDSDRFDEVPAFTAEIGRFEFVLFGIPDGDVEPDEGDIENYWLELYDSGSGDVSLSGLVKAINLDCVSPGNDGYCDLSQQVSEVINESGILDCNCS